MFEKLGKANPNLWPHIEKIEEIVREYPYLKDFCTYINKRRTLTWLEYYLFIGESMWLEAMQKGNVPKHFFDIENSFPFAEIDDGVPNSLKYYLIEVSQHLGVSNRQQDVIKWYKESYRSSMPWSRLGRGKQILRRYELEGLLQFSSFQFHQPSVEERRMAEIANAVTGEHTGGGTISEREMCKALEYAAENNYTAVLRFGYPQCLHPNFGDKEHIEYEEIRAIALKLIENDPYYDDVVQLRHDGAVHLFLAYNKGGTQPSPDHHSTIAVYDGKAEWTD